MDSLRLNGGQIRKISDIAADVGTVALASVVIPSVLTKTVTETTFNGILITLILWFVSIIIRK